MQPEYPTWSEVFIFLMVFSIFIVFLNMLLLGVLIRTLSKRPPTVDDPTGEKKQKIFDSLTQAVEDIKSTV